MHTIAIIDSVGLAAVLASWNESATKADLWAEELFCFTIHISNSNYQS